MYVPRHFAQGGREHLLTVMREHAFATVVGVIDGEPFATHAPVRVDDSVQDVLRIEGHVAAANPHARGLDGSARTLVIFHGPHTYISPTLYRNAGRVPTWNYIAVHASGMPRAIHDPQAKSDLLDRLIAQHEPSFGPVFGGFETRHRDAMLNAITGFDLVVDKLEGKFKLGQHRLADDLPAMQAMHEGGDADQRSIARWMKRLGYWA